MSCRRAVRDIRPGEELTTAYTELGATRWERRAELLQHHLFDIDAPPEAGAGGGAAVAGAEAAGEGSFQAKRQAAERAALQCLPAQPPAAVHPLPQADAEPAGELRLYGSLLPPWAHDERDIELTAVLAPEGTGANHGGQRGQGTRWGGMWGCLPAASSTAVRADASTSFELDDQLLDAAAEASALLDASSGSPAGPVGGLNTRAAGAAPGVQRQTPIVHCWREGGVDLAAAVLELAAQYAAALQLLRAVDGLLAAGSAAAAVRQLLAALAALGSGSRAANGQHPAAGSGAALVLGPRHILRLRLLADLHRAAIAAGQWEVALRAGQQLLPLAEFVYPPVGAPGPP